MRKDFYLLKKIILVSATEKYSSKNDILPQQYIRIIKNLSKAELLILIAAFNASKELDWKDNTTPKKRIGDWKEEVLKRSGLEFIELLDIELSKLVDKKLVVPPEYGDGSGLVLGQHFRLTNLAYNLLLFVENFQNEV